MREDHAAGLGLNRKLGEFFAVGVAAQFEAFNAGVEFRGDVGCLEEELFAVLRLEEFAAGCVGVAVADEADRVMRIGDHARGERVAGRAFDQHAGADDVERVLLEVLAGFELARGGLHVEFLDDIPVELHVLILARNFVEVVGKRHAHAGGVNRAFHEATKFAGVVDDREDFLHAAECEHREEERAAAIDGIVDGVDQAGDLVNAFFAELALGGAAGRLHDDGVEVARRELRAAEGALVLKEHVPGHEDVAMLVADLDSTGAGDVSGMVQHDLHLVGLALEFLGLEKLHADEARHAAVDLFVREERVIGDVVLLFLAQHDVGRVVEHAIQYHLARMGHDDLGIRVLAHGDRHAADVVQVTVGDDDEIEADIFDQREIGHRAQACFLRIQAAVDEDIHIANLHVE